MRNKGITILSLIITVIIMIILASVSINLITNGGIIDKTKTAAKGYAYQAEKEQFELAKIGATDYSTGKVDEEKLEKALDGWLYEDGIWTSPSGNEFSKDYNIDTTSEETGGEVIDSEEVEMLEKYIFGNDKNGRSIIEILNFSEEKFLDDLEIFENASEKLKFGYIDLIETYSVCFEYKNNLFNFTILTDGSLFTNKEYGLKLITNKDLNSRVGKYVKYVNDNNSNWIILYDDKTNGLQLVSKNSFKYKDNEFCLGSKDSSVEDWTGIATDDKEKAIWSYNNAITTLNETCEKLVKPSENIKDIRSIGSNPKNPNEDKDYLISDKLQGVAAGIYNGKLKDTDNNFPKDLEQLALLGILKAPYEDETPADYWLASHWVDEKSDGYEFEISFFMDAGSNLLFSRIFSAKDLISGHNFSHALRPVIILTEDIQKNGFASGTGTKDDPYILN